MITPFQGYGGVSTILVTRFSGTHSRIHRNGFAYGPPEAIPGPSGGLARSATDAGPPIYAVALYRFPRSFAWPATAEEIYDPPK